ncbi:acyltransferase [Niallia circulans]|jgi:acetyltransferase-like isoleucine patch superfamily enzyme|uniref:acyltransferase n=1 Tax=Niallia circulans TaxID=1397 RepID=UPI003D9A0260
MNFLNRIKSSVLSRRYSKAFNIGNNFSFGEITLVGRQKDCINIGNNVTILRYTEILGKPELPIYIGDNTYINQRCVIRPNTKIGRRVSIGPGVMLMTDTHLVGSPKRRAGKSINPPIIIEDGCWIGAHSTVLGNVTIGKGTIIGAGSVVNKDCEPNSLYAGVPARFVKKLEH